MTVGILFRSDGRGRLAAVVRTGEGVFDLDRRADGWRCSCGHIGCAHARHLRDTLTLAGEESH